MSIIDEKVVSRMVPTIDDDMNGFRHSLIRLALSDTSYSSLAVLQGLLAVSAYHLYGTGAGLPHIFVAVQALAYSMRHSSTSRDRVGQLAASMVLMSYQLFDTSESNWTTHFCGAKKIAKSISSGYPGQDSDLIFLLDWFFHHDALAKFSLHFWTQKTEGQRQCEKDPYILTTIPESSTWTHVNLVSHTFFLQFIA